MTYNMDVHNPRIPGLKGLGAEYLSSCLTAGPYISPSRCPPFQHIVDLALIFRAKHHWFYKDDGVPRYLGLIRSRQFSGRKISVPGIHWDGYVYKAIAPIECPTPTRFRVVKSTSMPFPRP